MILIGTMDWASTRLRGMFMCPSCGSNQNFRLRASRPFLTLYFIPLIPIGGLQEFVQCSQCKDSFESSVLSTHIVPQGEADADSPTFEDDLLKLVALMMIEDGHVTENEIVAATRLYENITQLTISRQELGKACSQVKVHRLSTLSFLTTAGRRFEHQQKLLAVQAMFGIASADGDITPGRMASLVEAQQLLELDEQEFQMAIEATGQWLN